MKKIMAIFSRDVKSYFQSPVAYIVIAGFIVFSSISFYYRVTNYPEIITAAQDNGILDEVKQNRINYFVISPVLNDVGYILMFLIPIITMRLWSEEKRARTDELLLTSPLSVSTMVVGKYLAGMVFVLVLLFITLVHILFLFLVHSGPDVGVTVLSYVAMFLFAATAVGIGLFTSTLTENQIIASVSCLIAELVFATFGGVAGSVNSIILSKVLRYLSWQEHLSNFFDGVVMSGDLIFFSGMVFLWLFMAYQSVESSRWR